MKKCTGKCKLLLPIEQYNKNKSKPDGLNTVCKECSRERSRQYYQENKEHHIKVIGQRNKQIQDNLKQYVLDYLCEHPCVDCGEDDPIVLEFDHVRGKKIGNVSNLIKWNSLEKIKKEIDKCEVRCANDHRRKTSRDFNWFRGGVTQVAE